MVNRSKLINGLNNCAVRPLPRHLPGDLAASPCGDPATWLIVGVATAAVVAAAAAAPPPPLAGSAIPPAVGDELAKVRIIQLN